MIDVVLVICGICLIVLAALQQPIPAPVLGIGVGLAAIGLYYLVPSNRDT